MPIVNIDFGSKLTKEQKGAVAKGVTASIATATGVPEEAVIVIINEVDKDNIAKAGVLFSDRT
jgi:4-oxalocrotonate tautomerase